MFNRSKTKALKDNAASASVRRSGPGIAQMAASIAPSPAAAASTERRNSAPAGDVARPVCLTRQLSAGREAD